MLPTGYMRRGIRHRIFFGYLHLGNVHIPGGPLIPEVFHFAYFLPFFWHLGMDYLLCWQG
jgi:hypothetical protein